jgi:threonine aldolase
VPPRIVSITQATERGRVYRPEEIAAIAAVVRRHGLKLHMDGARFANAVVSLGCTAAELVAHVDVLSFGATKNGAMMAEALVVFDDSLTARMAQRIRRAGQCASKQRFMAAQLIAYLEDDLWLRNARAANAAARLLAQGLSTLPGIALRWPVEANLVFATIDPGAQARLAAQDIAFRPRDSKRPEDNLFRLVPSFATTPAAIEALLDRCRRALG